MGTVIDGVTINDSFPYNKNQETLHVSEKMVMKTIKSGVKDRAKNKEEEKKLLKEDLKKIEIIKNQDPHPAKVLGPFPYCFWDYDVYWMHWDWHKHLIIPRILKFDLDKAIEVLERFYTKEEIVNTVKSVGEVVSDRACEFLADRYGVERFYQWQ